MFAVRFGVLFHGTDGMSGCLLGARCPKRFTHGGLASLGSLALGSYSSKWKSVAIDRIL